MAAEMPMGKTICEDCSAAASGFGHLRSKTDYEIISIDIESVC